MVLKSYKAAGIGSDEMAIRKWAFPPDGPNQTNYLSGTSTATDKVLGHYCSIKSSFTDYNQDTRGGNVSQYDLIYEIDRGRPILSGRLIADGTATGRKHMFVIRGYTGSGGSTVGKVIYIDPATGTRNEQSYAEFVRQGDDYIWYQTLRLLTNPTSPIPTPVGSTDWVMITSGTTSISPSTSTLAYTASQSRFSTTTWDWKLIFPCVAGLNVVRSWNVTNSNNPLTWNISNFSLPAGNQWKYDFDGVLPGKVEATITFPDGTKCSHSYGTVYNPSALYPGVLVYENKTVSSSQADVKAHEAIIMLNDQFNAGTNIDFKSGGKIDINDGVTINNGGSTDFIVDPALW